MFLQVKDAFYAFSVSERAKSRKSMAELEFMKTHTDHMFCLNVKRRFPLKRDKRKLIESRCSIVSFPVIKKAQKTNAQLVRIHLIYFWDISRSFLFSTAGNIFKF